MIEVIYSGETKQPKAAEDASRSTLKNIRQIGNINGNTRIYVENDTMGFLERQIKKKTPFVLALLGKEVIEEEKISLFVNGAVVAEKIAVKGSMLEFQTDAFTELYDEAAAYFPKSVILGWCLPVYEMIDAYGNVLGDYSRLFLVEEPAEQEMVFYIQKDRRLTRLGGYYIYFQNNEPMKHYIRQFKEAEEDMPKREQEEDKPKLHAAARTEVPKKPLADGKAEEKSAWKLSERRKAEKQKFDEKNTKKAVFQDDYEEETEAFFGEQPKLTAFLYGVSTVLAIVILVIGITMISNYERMYEMQETIETIAGSIVNDRGNQDEAAEQNDGKEADETEEPLQEDNGQGAKQEVTEQAEESSGQTDGDGETVTNETIDVQTAGTAGAAEGLRAAAGNAVIYTVQEGDTLTSISRKFYLTDDYVDKILEANEGLKQNEITVGQKIVLP